MKFYFSCPQCGAGLATEVEILSLGYPEKDGDTGDPIEWNAAQQICEECRTVLGHDYLVEYEGMAIAKQALEEAKDEYYGPDGPEDDR